MASKRIQQLKDAFNLKPHPEGGFYSEEYRSNDLVTSPITNTSRSAISHIYFLLTESDVSRWHRVVHDEIWHVYEGDPLRILDFDPNSLNNNISEKRIGDISAEITSPYYKVIHGGHYQAAETTGNYTFMGCCVAPGFVFDDFNYINEPDLKQWVVNQGKDYNKFL